VLELIKAGGIVMIPIIASSIIALAVIVERFWTLKRERVMPPHLVAQIWQWEQATELSIARIRALRSSSPLGRILASGLLNRKRPYEIMKASIEDTGRHVVHDLERFLNTLGTIAAVSPLMGLLGTVFGMIQVFTAITESGVGAGDPADLAGGIGKALITTAAGLVVAIPSLIAYRYFRGHVDELVISMEQEAIRLVEVMENARQNNEAQGSDP
jgi:biopolymer transport protein ExbB